MARQQTLYELLEVSSSATFEEIEQSYQRIAAYLGAESLAVYSILEGEDAASMRTQLDEAYRTLSDPDRRAAYDRARREESNYPPITVPAGHRGDTSVSHAASAFADESSRNADDYAADRSDALGAWSASADESKAMKEPGAIESGRPRGKITRPPLRGPAARTGRTPLYGRDIPTREPRDPSDAIDLQPRERSPRYGRLPEPRGGEPPNQRWSVRDAEARAPHENPRNDGGRRDVTSRELQSRDALAREPHSRDSQSRDALPRDALSRDALPRESSRDESRQEPRNEVYAEAYARPAARAMASDDRSRYAEDARSSPRHDDGESRSDHRVRDDGRGRGESELAREEYRMRGDEALDREAARLSEEREDTRRLDEARAEARRVEENRTRMEETRAEERRVEARRAEEARMRSEELRAEERRAEERRQDERRELDDSRPELVRTASDVLEPRQKSKVPLPPALSATAKAKRRMLTPSLTIDIGPDTEFGGAIIRRLRESTDASLEEVAEITKVSKRYLIAIENNDFAALPAAVYTRGFVAEYARVLGLDAQMVTKSFMSLYAKYRGVGG